MYAAFLNKKLVLAKTEAWKVKNKQKKLNSEIYHCPHCQKRVILVLSENQIAFFKHLKKFTGQMGEKAEHSSAKLALKSAFTAAGFPAQIEMPLANGKLRADVLVKQNLAIEVQCAPLSKEEFVHRHSLYQQIGVFDLWIVGRRHYLGRQLKKTQLIFFRHNKQWGDYYLEVLAKKSLLRLKHHIREAPISRQLFYQTTFFTLDEVGLKQLWHFQSTYQARHINGRQQKEYLWKQIHQKTKLGCLIAEKLYQKKITIDSLPTKLFTNYRRPGEENLVIKYLQQKTTNL